MGAAIVGLAWLFLGTGSSSGVSASLASLGQAPGIAPPDYAYLDTAQVALYLGQLEGGISTSEQLTQQLTQGRNAGLSAGGLSLGGSTGSQSTAERVVSPTATARFYQLLDLLGRDGYLHTINEASSAAKLEQAFSRVRQGSFVELQNCKLKVPSFVALGAFARLDGSSVRARPLPHRYTFHGGERHVPHVVRRVGERQAGGRASEVGHGQPRGE